MKKLLLTSVGVVALTAPSAAFAQSTGSIDFNEEIIVTGQSATDVNGVEIPDTPKAKQVLTQDLISKQGPGQTILDTVNLVPGVNFQNNDAYGSAGGTLNIRGFAGDRVSLTFDGVPLNDGGNYAVYSNQQLSPELIEQVNVNLGSTDVDSPTASAAGGTVNYRTRLPYEEFSVRAAGSIGDQDYMRIFASIDTGNLTEGGLRAFVAAEKVDYNWAYAPGKIDKKQINARIYQPLGDNGDFISIAGHYNQNRNNFGGSVRLDRLVNLAATDTEKPLTVTRDGRYDLSLQGLETCPIDVPQAGVADSTNSCGTQFYRRWNPSDTGNIRINSKFSLTDNITLTIDPNYQYVKANGGGVRAAVEAAHGSGYVGYIGGTAYYGGVDLNGDGDTLDRVIIAEPSQTQTDRYGVISSLRFDVSDAHSLRIGYTFDKVDTAQTGQNGVVYIDGSTDYYPVDNPLVDVNGNVLNKRDRVTVSTLHQISGEYRGEFLDEKLVVNLGVRAPFFNRELTQNCFTTAANGNVNCIYGAQATAYATANPTYARPQTREYDFDEILPSAGFSFRMTDAFSVFGSWSRGISMPKNDDLYAAFFYPEASGLGVPNPEKTDSFDLGLRYGSGMVQAQVTGWYTKYANRTASAYDPVNDVTVYRNLGKVDYYGVDGSISFRPVDMFAIYLFGSWKDTEIKDDVANGTNCTGLSATYCYITSGDAYVVTTGKQVSGTSHESYGASAELNLGPILLGATAKYTGARWVNDINKDEIPGYWLVNLNARIGLEWAGLNDKTFIQLNMYNATDEVYIGGFGGGLTSNTPFVQLGAPRTFSATVNFQF